MTLQTKQNPPTLFPEDLFTGHSKAESKVWWVARTKSRQEKTFAWYLKSRNSPYFLPMTAKPQNCRGRARVSILPLFNGYLFFKGSENDRYAALCSGRLAQVIEVNDQIRFSQEISQLSIASSSQMQLSLCDFAKKGQKVRIISGPLKGLKGTVLNGRNKTRLVLKLEAIRQAASVEIPRDIVCPA